MRNEKLENLKRHASLLQAGVDAQEIKIAKLRIIEIDKAIASQESADGCAKGLIIFLAAVCYILALICFWAISVAKPEGKIYLTLLSMFCLGIGIFLTVRLINTNKNGSLADVRIQELLKEKQQLEDKIKKIDLRYNQ